MKNRTQLLKLLSDANRGIFDMYTEQNMGATKIALTLNSENIKTSRGAKFSKNMIQALLGIGATGMLEI